MEKYGNMIISFTFLIILIVGMWLLIGKMADGNNAIASSNERIADKLDKIYGRVPVVDDSPSGLVSAGGDNG